VRENRTPGSVRGLSGNWQSYRNQLPFDANDSAEVNRPKDQAKEEAWKAHPEILA